MTLITSRRKPRALRAVPADLVAKLTYGPYLAVVEEVLDGDTIAVLADLGCQEYTYQHIRLRHFSAPEKDAKTAAERELAQIAITHMHTYAPVGTVGLLRTYRTLTTPLDEQRSFVRYLGDFLLTGDRQLADLLTTAMQAALRMRALQELPL